MLVCTSEEPSLPFVVKRPSQLLRGGAWQGALFVYEEAEREWRGGG